MAGHAADMADNPIWGWAGWPGEETGGNSEGQKGASGKEAMLNISTNVLIWEKRKNHHDPHPKSIGADNAGAVVHEEIRRKWERGSRMQIWMFLKGEAKCNSIRQARRFQSGIMSMPLKFTYRMGVEYL